MNRREFLKLSGAVCAGGLLFCGSGPVCAYNAEQAELLEKLTVFNDRHKNISPPRDITIEACSLCQLCCPLCKRPEKAGYLKFKDFKRFIDNNPEIKRIEIAYNGEIFLNPELLQIVKYAYEKNVTLSGYGGTNFNTVSEEMLEALVKYRFEGLNVAIDGASPETYSKYRLGGNFDNVINNVKKLNYYKEKYNSEFPILRWQFVVFGHNEHEIPAAKIIAKELNMKEIYFRHSCDNSFSPIKDAGFVGKEIPGFYDTKYGFYFYHWTGCHELWTKPVINYDGQILGCYNNGSELGSFGGNAFHKKLQDIVNMPKILYTKEMFLGNVPEREDIPCTKCQAYNAIKDRRQSHQFS